MHNPTPTGKIGYSDEDIKDFLIRLDEADIEVTDWEAEFLESMLNRFDREMTDKQRAVCMDLMRKYKRAVQ